MDDNKYTYPDTPTNIGFTEAEKKRWDRNLKRLVDKTHAKFGKKSKGNKRKKSRAYDDDNEDYDNDNSFTADDDSESVVAEEVEG